MASFSSMNLSTISLALTACTLLLLSLPPTTAASLENNKQPDYIPYDNWLCGASDFDKQLSHQMAGDDCPHRMFEANLCCLAHDLCYMEDDKSQEFCDSAFCFCLTRTVAEPARGSNHSQGCAGVADSYCTIVQLFGSDAHSNAKEAKKTTTLPPSTTTTTTTTTITPAPSTTTRAASTTTPATTTTSTTAFAPKEKMTTPAQIAEVVAHNISLKCYSSEMSACLNNLHRCVGTFHKENGQLEVSGSSSPLASWAGCSQRFCDCTATLPPMSVDGETEGDEECHNPINQICRRVGGKKYGYLEADPGVNAHFWSVNVQYVGFSVDLLTAFFGCLLALVVLCVLLYASYHIYRRLRRRGASLSMEHHFGGNFDSSSRPRAHRRHTLNLRDCESGYKPFHDKLSTSERPPLSSAHLLSSHHNLIPLNNSKAHLIADDGNSSSSSPSINSSE